MKLRVVQRRLEFPACVFSAAIIAVSIPSNSRCSLKLSLRGFEELIADCAELMVDGLCAAACHADCIRASRSFFLFEIVGVIARLHEQPVFLEREHLVANAIQEVTIVTHHQHRAVKVRQRFLQHPQAWANPGHWSAHPAPARSRHGATPSPASKRAPLATRQTAPLAHSGARRQTGIGANKRRALNCWVPNKTVSFPCGQISCRTVPVPSSCIRLWSM